MVNTAGLASEPLPLNSSSVAALKTPLPLSPALRMPILKRRLSGSATESGRMTRSRAPSGEPCTFQKRGWVEKPTVVRALSGLSALSPMEFHAEAAKL